MRAKVALVISIVIERQRFGLLKLSYCPRPFGKERKK